MRVSRLNLRPGRDAVARQYTRLVQDETIGHMPKETMTRFRQDYAVTPVSGLERASSSSSSSSHHHLVQYQESHELERTTPAAGKLKTL